MSRFLPDWSPSDAAINLIKLNGIDDVIIERSVVYLRDQSGLHDIDDVDGYDNWDTFFIMFCIKVANNENAGDKGN